MKKIRCLLFLALCLLLGSVVSGCGEENRAQSEYQVFYVNKDGTKVVPVDFEPESDNDNGIINEMIVKLCQNPESVDYKKPLPGHVKIDKWNLEKGQLTLNFNSDYSNMDNVSEVLCRAALVRTLTQVKSVDYVAFYVGDTTLTDKNGNPVGLMTAESFIENPGEQINSYQNTNITLYFSNKEGTGLVKEQRPVYYSTNISMEKLVMEYLLKGPESSEAMQAIPRGTKLVSVSVLDGVCFVNLDQGFMNQNYEISEGVVIYSIVDSLVELPNVNKVQISVNGDTSATYREKYSLSTVYDRNLDFIENSEEKQEDGETGEVDPPGQGEMETENLQGGNNG